VHRMAEKFCVNLCRLRGPWIGERGIAIVGVQSVRIIKIAETEMAGGCCALTWSEKCRGYAADKRDSDRYASKTALGSMPIAASEWGRAMTLAGTCARWSTFVCHGESWGCCGWRGWRVSAVAEKYLREA
jgi:hypothetical protein